MQGAVGRKVIRLDKCWVIAGGWRVDGMVWCEQGAFESPISAQFWFLVFWSLCCEVEMKVEEGYSRRYEGLAYVAVCYC